MGSMCSKVSLFQCRHTVHTDSSCVLYCIQFESETNRSGLLLSERQQPLVSLLNLHRQEVSSVPEGNH